LEEVQGGFFTKKRDFLDEISSPLHLKQPPRKPDQKYSPPRISWRITRIPKKPSKATAMPQASDGL